MTPLIIPDPTTEFWHVHSPVNGLRYAVWTFEAFTDQGRVDVKAALIEQMFPLTQEERLARIELEEQEETEEIAA